MSKLKLSQPHYIIAASIFFLFASANPALADFSEIAGNIILSIQSLPGLVTGIAYLTGLFLGIKGILKFREHVENPGNVALRFPIIYLAAGGALFSLPIVYEAMLNTIDKKNILEFILDALSGIFESGGTGSEAGGSGGINEILKNIVSSVNLVPGLVSGVSYLLGIVLGVAGILKIKENVEDANRTHIKEGVIRLIVGGMLFALPTLYEAMFVSIDGAGIESGDEGYLDGATAGTTSEGGQGCSDESSGSTLGGVICNMFDSTSLFPVFLSAIAYLFGIFVGVWGILRLQNHVSQPEQTQVWDPVAKFAVAGGLFALPSVVNAAYNTVGALIDPHSNSGFNDETTSGNGLDAMLVKLMTDVFSPLSVLINWFGIVAGIILVFIGITRLMKSSQEGARGPGGVGTIMTFIAGGALLAFSPMVTALTASLFDSGTTTNGALQYTAGMDANAVGHANAVIAAVIRFVLLLGLISIARGIFMIRGIAEGNSQASPMAAYTHLIGGALAVNLGPVLTAVQTTLGITEMGVGITFQ